MVFWGSLRHGARHDITLLLSSLRKVAALLPDVYDVQCIITYVGMMGDLNLMDFNREPWFFKQNL